MPQISLRLPNSSSGGELSRFSIEDRPREQIKTLFGSSLDDPQVAALISEIERIVAKYLYLVEAAMSAPLFDKRKEEFSALRRQLASVQHRLEKLQNGDVGDFYSGYIEHNLSHPLLDRCPLGKLTEFFDRTRQLSDLILAVEKACEAGLREALASAQAGLQPVRIWDIWIREMAIVCDERGLSTAVRNDELGTSSFVQLIDIIQSSLDQKYRQHTASAAALSQAVLRAFRERVYAD